MRIGYITCVIYNTPDNLRIALEDNLIENSAKNSENHKLRINSPNTLLQIALQCNAASYGMSCMYEWCLQCGQVSLANTKTVDKSHISSISAAQGIVMNCL